MRRVICGHGPFVDHHTQGLILQRVECGRGTRTPHTTPQRGESRSRLYPRPGAGGVLLLLLILLFPVVSHAQGLNQFESPSGLDYSEWNWPLCISPTNPGNGFVDPQCLSDETEENTTREEVKAEDRWLRAGLLMLAQVWSGVETLRDIIQRGEHVVQTVDRLIHGTTRLLPHAVAVRLMDASDAAEDRLHQAEHLATAIPFNGGEVRYADLHTLAMRALGVARDAQSVATTLADQASGLQSRLEQTGLTLVTVGAGPSTNGQTDFPPLPDDADSSAMAVYSTVTTLPSATVASRSGPARGFAAVRDVSPSASQTDSDGTAGADTTSGADAGASCPLSDDDAPDPQVEYVRTSVMAKGAETSTAATLADVQQTRDEIRTLREREAEAEREAFWLNFLHFIKML